MSIVSTCPELKFETRTVSLGAAVMSLGNRPAGMSPTTAERPSSAAAWSRLARTAEALPIQKAISSRLLESVAAVKAVARCRATAG